MEDTSQPGFLVGGRAADLIRAIDWSDNPLGPIAGWSDCLKIVLGTNLRSLEPIVIFWGPEFIQLYNDAFIDQGISRHPGQMGKPLAVTWPEFAGELVPQMREVMYTGRAMQFVDRMFTIVRDERPVDIYLNFGLGPVSDPDGQVLGIITVLVETTQRVLDMERQGVLRVLAERLASYHVPNALEPLVAHSMAVTACDRTDLRFYCTPRTRFDPTPCQLGSAPDDGDVLGTCRLAFQAHPSMFDLLASGQEVRFAERLLVPVRLDDGTDFLRFVDFRLDPRLPFDEAYWTYLRRIAQLVEQSVERSMRNVVRADSPSDRDDLLLRAPIAIAILAGPKLVYTLANDRYREIVGPRELIGKTYEEAFPELVGTEFPPLVHRLYESGETHVSAETAIDLDTRRNGVLETRHIQFTLQPLRTAEGDVYALMTIVVDLTEQVRQRHSAERAHAADRAELEYRAVTLEATVRERTESLQGANRAMSTAHDALEKAAAFTRNVTEMVPGRIVYWSADLVCRFANHVFCEWVGRPIEEVVGAHMTDLFPAEVIERTRVHVEGVLRGEPQRFESRTVRADGRVFFNQVNYTPEPGDPPLRPGFYQLAIDITPLKEAEAALKELNADLARSRDEAEAASRSKSAFLANMSHEIRTPLNAILGMTHILARRLGDATHLDQLAKVDAAGRHLLGLISDLLDLSKIEAGKLALEANDFRMSDVVAWSLDVVRDAATAKGLTLFNDTASLPEGMRGDSLRLSQILINLLTNAVKFTSTGFIVLRGDVLEAREGRRHVWFEVQDTGIGIDEAKQHSLFGAFEQADSSISRRHGGTGLGLALSRQLARAMGGDAGVESRLGAGSRFWFSVWLQEGSGQAGPALQRQAPGTDGRARHLAELEAQLRLAHAGKRVLIAEDNPVNLEVGVALLEDVGLVVDSAADGREAIAKVKSGRYDLVLMDMQMPNVDGLEATRTIRAEMNPVPIIAMTANAFIVDRHACLAAGMDDHISKPVRPQTLYAMLLRWLPAVHVVEAADER